jgi:hypothetical protein
MNYWLLVVLSSIAFAALNASDLPKAVIADDRNREQVVAPLLPVLKACGGTGRIYFSGACSGGKFPFPIFPKVSVRATQQRNALEAVRDIFGKDKSVRVVRDRSGMIRITMGQPPTALLQTKVKSLRFNTDEQYNGWRAVGAVLNAKEVQSAMHKLGLEKGVKMDIGPIAVPEPGRPLPHLAASIKNMTMDQALDVVAETFGGIVIYETCEEPGGKRLVFLDFLQVAEHQSNRK